MTVPYVLTDTAKNELGQLLSYVATKSGAGRALQVHHAFVTAFEHLATLPDAGSKHSALTGERIRWWSVYRWRVIYDPDAAPLLILRIIHSRRQVSRVMRAEH